jgi:hypothetical protein
MGNAVIQSFDIQYGTVGFGIKQHTWKGILPVHGSVIITLPGRIDYKTGKNKFQAALSKPNGNKDAFAADNKMISDFYAPPAHDSTLVLYILTNNESGQNACILQNSAGDTVFQRATGSLKANTEYRDTLKLVPDAYELTLLDSAGNGLEFWYNGKGGRGTARLMNVNGELLKAVESDFGSIWQYRFVVGPVPDAVKNEEYAIGLFPTRTKDKTTLDYFANKPQDVIVRLVTDPVGKIVEEHHYSQLKEAIITYDLKRYPKGRFYLKVIINGEEKFNKRIRYNE